MNLPVQPLATGEHEVAGETVKLRSLSRDEVVRLGLMAEDPGGAEVLMIAAATGVTTDEAQAWREKVDSVTAGELLRAIRDLSGLSPGNASPSSRRSSGR
jgi:hypothetical protein